MNVNVVSIAAAFADVRDAEPNAPIDAVRGVPQTASSTLASLETACDWELNCRAGLDYELQPPEPAIPADEGAVSIGAAIAMGANFADDAPTGRALSDALVHLLTGAGRQHWRRIATA